MKPKHSIRLTIQGWVALVLALMLLVLVCFHGAWWPVLAFWLFFVWSKYENSKR